VLARFGLDAGVGALMPPSARIMGGAALEGWMREQGVHPDFAAGDVDVWVHADTDAAFDACDRATWPRSLSDTIDMWTAYLEARGYDTHAPRAWYSSTSDDEACAWRTRDLRLILNFTKTFQEGYCRNTRQVQLIVVRRPPQAVLPDFDLSCTAVAAAWDADARRFVLTALFPDDVRRGTMRRMPSVDRELAYAAAAVDVAQECTAALGGASCAPSKRAVLHEMRAAAEAKVTQLRRRFAKRVVKYEARGFVMRFDVAEH